jgi:5-methylcytosine-specific restriction enzyme A
VTPLPSRPPRPCASPGCPGSAEYRGRCAAHSTAANRERLANDAATYNSVWRRLRRMQLAEFPLCSECEKAGIIEPATQVDHRIPVKSRPDLRLTFENLNSLCARHHSEKTARETGFGRGGLAHPGTPAGTEGRGSR